MQRAACDPNYEVRYALRGAASTSVGANSITALEYGRRLDDISKAKVTHNLNDSSCCELLGILEPWADSLEVYKDNGAKWTGVITSVEYSRDQVIVEAQDELVFLRHRNMTADYDKSQEPSAAFAEIYNNAMANDTRPVNIVLYPYTDGTLDARKILTSRNRIAWFVVKDMLEGTVDVTMLGQTMHVGDLKFKGQHGLGRQINLNTEDFAGELTVRKAGELFATQVVVEGSRAVKAEYPATVDIPDSIYPLVIDVVYNEEITSVDAALQVAKSRWEYSSGVVPRVVRARDALQLRQGAVDIDRLIPSTIVSLDVSDLCYTDRQQYRLGNVDVTYAGGIEEISISLQPIGTLSLLESITSDDDNGAGEGL